MKKIQIGEEIFDWQGTTEILSSSYFKITLEKPAKLIEINTDTSKQGIIILGQVEVTVDSIIYTKSHGAIGNTIIFSGKKLVVLGISIMEIESSVRRSNLNEQEKQFFKNEAQEMVEKLRRSIEDKKSSVHINFENSREKEFIIFGRRNFFLIGTGKKFVLVHKKQISIREGEFKLVQINKEEGILIAEKNRVFTIGSPKENSIGSLLGEIGVNIASSILDTFLWD